MRKDKSIAKLLSLITPLGYTIEQGRKHRHIVNPVGQRIYSFSNTPSDIHFEDQTIRDLIRRKIIPIMKKK